MSTKENQNEVPCEEQEDATPLKCRYLEIPPSSTDITSPMTQHSGTFTIDSSCKDEGPGSKESHEAEAIMSPSDEYKARNSQQGFWVTADVEHKTAHYKKRLAITVDCAFQLRVARRLVSENGGNGRLTKYSNGQIGIVADNDGIIRFVSCIHTMAQKKIENETYICYDAQVFVPHNGPHCGQSFFVDFPVVHRPLSTITENPAVLRDGKTWKFGFDISWGESLTDFLGALPRGGVDVFSGRCFKRCNDTPSIGDRIGIAVYSSHTVTINLAAKNSEYRQAALVENGEINLSDFFGPPHVVTIFAGVITYVGAGYIEYTMNTFKGCSGAVIFRLEEDIPGLNTGDELEEWRPAAIGIHAGHHPGLGGNIGFLFQPNEDA